MTMNDKWFENILPLLIGSLKRIVREKILIFLKLVILRLKVAFVI